ncbi:hypothetical protein [Streptomyces cylindrosporus]|uniref:Uncharacterized protein n=1 Tax=Streptomyces cylindrosporus TaxID=2927583 RepID=A0ABS9YKC0_9ACTN|nr:hypothetical protein [Streptomyces cylindrosporus]MCI3277639.1 hypothetical protein [Streptomyces cylindrosporus]
MSQTLTDPAVDEVEHPTGRALAVPQIGQRVFYRLDDGAIRAIHRQRLTAHVRGGPVRAGDVFPALIVRVHGSTPDAPCSLQVFLDGPDTYWAQHVICGAQAGTWAWPVRQEV